jgi:excisionase family DNA binding protein
VIQKQKTIGGIDMISQVYTHSEVETILKLSKVAVGNLLRSGRLRSVKYGRKYLVPATAIEDFLNGTTQERVVTQ